MPRSPRAPAPAQAPAPAPPATLHGAPRAARKLPAPAAAAVRRAKPAPAPGAAAAAALPPLGAHVSVAGGLATAFERAADLGCTAIQIFVKNGNQWRARPLADEEAAAFRAAHAGSAVGTVVAHASYLINLAAADPRIAAQSREALADELSRCARLGVAGLVIHPGAHLGAGEEAGLDRAAAALEEVLAAVAEVAPAGRGGAGRRGAGGKGSGAAGKGSSGGKGGGTASGGPPRVLLENTAGQGTCLGHRLEHLAGIRARLSARARRRVGICIDTCHAFAAGYPLHEAAGWRGFLTELDGRLGLAALGCIHLNDSLRPFASRRDRHAHIGEGEIGLPAFARVLAEPALAAVPMVLETEPGKEMEGHRRDLETLRGLAGARPEKGRPRRPSRG